jgi:hypothetical protein
MIGQPHEQPLKSCGVYLSNHTRDLGRLSSMEVAQPDDGRTMQAAPRKVTFAWLNQLVPVRLLLEELGADPANKMGLVGARQRRQEQGGPKLGCGTSELGQRDKNNIAGIHASDPGLMSDMV